MNTLRLIFFISFYMVLFSLVFCSPKKYDPEEGGFTPSHRYYESNLPNSQSQTHNNKYNRYNSTNQNRLTTAESKTDKESRFGIVYGASGNGNGGTYGNGVAYAPMKLDIGGIALGALIGLGAILIVPKIAHILSGGHGGYRSLDDEMLPITNILSRIDNSLEQHNIDSSSCMQRIICTYVHDATKNEKNGETGTLDEFILGFTNNSLFSYLLDGTSIQQSVEIGKSAEDAEKCSSLYPKCPLSKENVLKVISSLLPA